MDGRDTPGRPARAGRPGAAMTQSPIIVMPGLVPGICGRRGNGILLVEMVYPGGIASGDLGLLLFGAAPQDFLNNLVAPGEGGLDMGVI